MKVKKSGMNWLGRTVRKTGWAPVAVFAFYVVAANVFHGYERYPSLDIPTHFAGGLAAAYFLADAFDNVQEAIGPVPQSIRILLTLTSVCTIAVGWEFYEFFCDHVLGTHMQFGRDDTMSDLFYGMAGGMVFLVLQKVLRGASRLRRQTTAARKKVG